jgi:hypothetical protein
MSRTYFLNNNDQETRIWIFRPDEPSLFLESSLEFSDTGFSVYIADPFAGLQPILWNYESFDNEIQIPFRPTAILDSNIVSYLHQYVTSNSILISKQRNVIAEFLKFVVKNRIDYNAFFYYLEGAAKNETGRLLHYAEEISHSILRLHTMNSSHFLATGEIVVDANTLNLYAQEFGVDTIDEIAPLYARAMVLPADPRLDGLSKLIYATLLKIGLIHKTSRISIGAKFEELMQFMQDVLNIGMGTERMLAIGYFAGKFDGFIPIQKGAVPGKVFKRLKAAAWDLVLLRLPARLLAISPDDEISVAYICTSDRALWQVARTAKLQTVAKLMPDSPEGIPLMTYDPTPLELNMEPGLIERILESDRNWQRTRIPNITNAENRISYESLLSLITILENEVSNFCSSK